MPNRRNKLNLLKGADNLKCLTSHGRVLKHLRTVLYEMIDYTVCHLVRGLICLQGETYSTAHSYFRYGGV